MSPNIFSLYYCADYVLIRGSPHLNQYNINSLLLDEGGGGAICKLAVVRDESVAN